jgi:hypothetical protein
MCRFHYSIAASAALAGRGVAGRDLVLLGHGHIFRSAHHRVKYDDDFADFNCCARSLNGVRQWEQIIFIRDAPALRLLERRVDRREFGSEISAQSVHDGNDCERNAGCNQTIFNGSRARLVCDKSAKCFHVGMMKAKN